MNTEQLYTSVSLWNDESIPKQLDKPLHAFRVEDICNLIKSWIRNDIQYRRRKRKPR